MAVIESDSNRWSDNVVRMCDDNMGDILQTLTQFGIVTPHGNIDLDQH